MMWLETILRVFCVFLDRIVYWAVDKVYGLFIMISETGLFTQESISTIASRIYVLLGVFMLFKVSFSLISYVLNPDSMTDKSKGMGNLVTRIIIVLIGIIFIPYIFQAAYGLQNIILKDNIIGNIILGDVATSSFEADNGNYVDYGGRLMAYTTLSAFLKLNPAVVGDECADNPVDVNGNFNESACNFAALDDQINGALTVKEVLINGHYYKDTSVYFNTDLILLKADNEYGEEDWLFDYSPILSTLCGGFLAWILLLFCIDIATRSVKLGFLQLIAPIPVIAYIDPKGEKTFQKWLDECVKTYLDVFVRLIAIYFAIYIVATLELNGMHNLVTNETVDNVFVKIFIIFGALMFAKQLPDLISNILGIKLSGGFTLNPMKKLGQSPYAAGLIGAVGGAVGGMAANTWAAAKNKDWAGLIPSAIAGGASAGFRGAKFGLTSGGKGSALEMATKGIKASSQARNLRNKGYGIGDKIRDRATDIAGVKFSTGTTSQLKNEVNQLQQELANSRRNEQAMTTALNQRLSEKGNMTAGLLKTFDGHMENGAYVEKTYDSYLEMVAQMHASSSGVDWSTLDDAARDAIKSNVVTIGKAANEADFNSFNELYVARNNEDLRGKSLEKKINDLQDDMGKFKDRNK